MWARGKHWRLYLGDCLEVLTEWKSDFVDSVVCDPPYGLKFMGKDWDHGVPGVVYWEQIFRILKPGGYLLAFGGTRTHHRLMCAIEDAGFEIRDTLMWLYGCLSEDTEILIDGQWEPYHKAIEGSCVLCYDVEHDEFSWQLVQDLYVYEYSDIAYRIFSDSTDQIVSRNHRCIIEQDGTYGFQIAEEVARQCKARVPVLESLPDLLHDLSMFQQGASSQESVLSEKLYTEKAAEKEVFGSEGGTMGKLCCVRKADMEGECTFASGRNANLFPFMQRGSSGQGVGKARLQGAGRLDGKGHGKSQKENERQEQPGMEGRGYLFSKARKLQADQVRALSSGISFDGPEGRLCDGASINCGTGDRSMFTKNGNCASRKPQSAEQPVKEFDVVCQQPRSQTVRASRYTRTDLARVESVFYKGKVWCVRVPTGAFVARRNGKIFVTGNSGFPKSLNVSKAIDKAAGVERYVVGKAMSGPSSSGFEAKDRGNVKPAGPRHKEFDITVSATSDAKKWDGWGTALKPAFEPIIYARKPLTVVPVNDKLVADVQNLLGGLVCLLLSNASNAQSFSRLSPVGCEEASVSALMLAAVLHGNELGKLSDLTGTFNVPETGSTCLSIALLWNAILGEVLKNGSMFTTEMAIALTTGLETLNCLVSTNIPSSVIKAVSRLLGSVSYAPSVGSNLNDVKKSNNVTQNAFVRVLVTLWQGESGINAKNAVNSLRLITPSVVFALEHVLTVIGGVNKEKLQPNFEPIILARKPLSEKTVAANVLEHGTGGINIDGCRVDAQGETWEREPGMVKPTESIGTFKTGTRSVVQNSLGRWPANVILSHHPDCEQVGSIIVKGRQINRWKNGAKPFGGGAGHEFESKQFSDDEVAVYKCHEDCPVRQLDEQVGELKSGAFNSVVQKQRLFQIAKGSEKKRVRQDRKADSGSASRFFYCAKANKKEKNIGLPEGVSNLHPTVKPVALMEYLVRLVTPVGGVVLDPFMGSGSTGLASLRERFNFLGIDQDEESVQIAKYRLEHASQEVDSV